MVTSRPPPVAPPAAGAAKVQKKATKTSVAAKSLLAKALDSSTTVERLDQLAKMGLHDVFDLVMSQDFCRGFINEMQFLRRIQSLQGLVLDNCFLRPCRTQIGVLCSMISFLCVPPKEASKTIAKGRDNLALITDQVSLSRAHQKALKDRQKRLEHALKNATVGLYAQVDHTLAGKRGGHLCHSTGFATFFNVLILVNTVLTGIEMDYGWRPEWQSVLYSFKNYFPSTRKFFPPKPQRNRAFIKCRHPSVSVTNVTSW